MKKSVFILSASLLAFSSPAAAAIITFDDIVNSSTNDIYGSVSSDGYDFTGNHFHIIDFNDGRFVDNGTQYLMSEAIAPTTFSKTGGGTFNLNGADIAEFWLPGNSNNNFLEIVFTGNVMGGGVLTQAFTYDGLRDGVGGIADFESVLFSGWNNLLSVEVTGRNANGAIGDYSIDNIIVDQMGAIPEPATWAMMIFGFGLVGGAMRRRKADVKVSYV